MSETPTQAAKRYVTEREFYAHKMLHMGDLKALDGEALKALERQLSGLTSTNCSWALYAVKPLLLAQVNREYLRRARAE